MIPGSMRKFFRYSFLFVLAGILLFVSCKREWDNHWDEKASLDPASWAPDTLVVTDQEVGVKKLQWIAPEEKIEGFKIDRKKGSEGWKYAYAVLPQSAKSFLDTTIVLDTALTYKYRLYAYAGNCNSMNCEFSSGFSDYSPQDFRVEKQSERAYKLSWNAAVDGIDAYIIDRKSGENIWQKEYAILPAMQLDFIDTNVFRNSNIKYRIYSRYKDFQSEVITSTTDAVIMQPAALTSLRIAIDGIEIKWKAGAIGQDGFILERSYDSVYWQQLVKTTEESFIDRDFQLMEDVYYRIRAYISDAYSNAIVNKVYTDVPAPDEVEMEVDSINAITLNWEYSLTGIQEFIIDRKENSGSWESAYAVVDGDSVSYSDHNVNAKINKYAYRIRANQKGYESANVTLATPDFICGVHEINDERDGREYETVKIGNQCWMKENLNVGVMIDSSVVPTNNGIIEKYCYDNDAANCDEYGGLYNWLEVMNYQYENPAASICPEGWELPEDADWYELEDVLGGREEAGGNMKMMGIDYWRSPNEGATNSSGFSGKGAGRYTYISGFSSLVWYTNYWAYNRMGDQPDRAYVRSLIWNGTSLGRSNAPIEGYYYSLRCIKTEESK